MKAALALLSLSIGLVLGLSPVTSGITPYSYLGCFADPDDSTHPPVLYNDYRNDAGFSTKKVETCITLCAGKGFIYAGLEYHFVCRCDNSTVSTITSESDSECDTDCSDANTEACGGINRLSVYSVGGVALKAPAPAPKVAGGWVYLDCYTDDQNSNTLTNGAYDAGKGSTPEGCATFCAGYQYFGLEYGYQCFCSNTIATGATTSTQCDHACTDRRDLRCGGNYKIDIYQQSGFAASQSSASRVSVASASSASKVSYISAHSASQLSVASVRSDSSVSRASLQSAVSASKASYSSARSTAQAFVSSRQSAHAASLSSARASVSDNNVNHFSTESSLRSEARASASVSLSEARASRASVRSVLSASLSSARESRSVAGVDAASSKSSVASSRSVASYQHSQSQASVASVKSASSASRSSANAAATHH